MNASATSMFFRHLWIRLVAVERQPQGLGLLVAAALSSIVLWPLLVDAGQARHPFELLVLILRQVGLLLGAAGAPLFGAGRGVADAVSFRAAYLANNVHGLLLTLPVVLAWASPGFGRWSSLVKAEVAALVQFVLLMGGVMHHPRLGAVVCLVVAGLVLAAVGRELRLDPGRLFVPRRLWRRSPGAEAQLRRDLWSGPLAMGTWLALGLALGFLALAGPGRSVVTSALGCRPALLAVLAWANWGLLTMVILTLPLGVLLHPLGVKIVTRSPTAGGGLRRAPFASAWATLPVRPERLSRAVFHHGLATAALGWLLLLAHVLLSATFGLRRPLDPALELTLAGLPAALAVAGLLLCLAVADRRRGALALVALIGSLVALPLASIAANLAGLTALPARVTLIASVTLALSLVGGLPPLVHLRRPSRPA